MTYSTNTGQGNLWFVYGESAKHLSYLLYEGREDHGGPGLERDEKWVYMTFWNHHTKEATLSVKCEEHFDSTGKSAFREVVKAMVKQVECQVHEKIEAAERKQKATKRSTMYDLD